MLVILFGPIGIIRPIFLWQQLSKFQNRLELAFVKSFNVTTGSQEQFHRRPILARTASKNPCRIEINEIKRQPHYDHVGKERCEFKLPELTGITIIAIPLRGLTFSKLNPNSQLSLEDRVTLRGKELQINDARAGLLKESEDKKAKTYRYSVRHLEFLDRE
jgi:hypothetical protein